MRQNKYEIRKPKIYLLESGLWEKAGRDLTKIFIDEQKALKYCFRRFGIKKMQRENIQQIKGFRCAWHNRKRWALLTEHRILYYKKPFLGCVL